VTVVTTLRNITSTYIPVNFAIVSKIDRQDGTSGKTFASGTGGMGLNSRVDEIYHTLPTTRHSCNLWSV